MIFIIVNTAQHKDLLKPYWKIFKITPDITLDVMKEGQNLSSLTAKILQQLQTFIDSLNRKPQIILAQGDTTTVMSASLVAFYNRIKFVHLEAGLRSADFENPFPEEFNRRVAAIHATLHLAPTETAKNNLLKENYPVERIKVIGNTVIDALQFIKTSPQFNLTNFYNEDLKPIQHENKLVLITCHRRENQGKNLLTIIDTIVKLAKNNKRYHFIWAMHPNPRIKNVLLKSELNNQSNIILTSPLDYLDILKVMSKCILIITDSGGIQEEAPSFKVPVLVLREKTERPEGVEAGIAKLVGAEKEIILNSFNSFQSVKFPENYSNLYGDGKAAGRCVDYLIKEQAK